MKINAMVPLLNVEDAARSIEFYTDTLAFRVVQDFQADGRTVWAMLQNGDVRLMINAPGDPGSAYRRQRPSYGETVLYLYVESARDWRDALVAKGQIPSAITAEPYGMEEFQLRDPDGYEIAIGSPLTRVAG